MGLVSIETRVGGFVLIALAVLLAFIFALGDISLFPGHEVYVDFGYAGGLQVGAPVKVSGIRVGKVGDLSILNGNSKPPAAIPTDEIGRSDKPLVRASIVIDREHAGLATDTARFYIGTQGVVGESYLELAPAAGGAPLAAGSVMRGVDAPRLHLIALRGSALLDTLGSLIGSEKGLGLGGVGEALRALIDTVGGIVSERRTELSEALGELAATATDVRKISSQVRETLGDGSNLRRFMEDGSASAAMLREELPGILERATTSLASVEELSEKANRAIDTDEVEELMTNLRETMKNLQKVAVDAERVMNTIRRGQGTVGGLVTDPQVYDDLKEMLRDLKRNPWKLFWRD